MAEVIRYMWDISRVYFIWNRFLPFLFFMYLPLTVFAFITFETEARGYVYAQLVCLSLTSIYLLITAYRQIHDMCTLGFFGYFNSFATMYETILLLALSVFAYFAWELAISQL